jgi:RNA polymerase sigma-70 factor, ECF subfamily
MSSESDRLLIQQIRQGDQRAWEQLIARYEGRLLAFAVRRLRDRALSEDIVQETFIGFLHSLPNFDENRELQTYLFSIASYKVTDQLRKMGRRPVQTGEAAEERLAEQSDSSQRHASSVARSRERRDMESSALSRALGQMFAQWRDKAEYIRIQVLELLFVKGWQNRDVAKFLKISEQQVANYRFAAVKKLSEQMRAAGLPADVFPELQQASEE